MESNKDYGWHIFGYYYEGEGYDARMEFVHDVYADEDIVGDAEEKVANRLLELMKLGATEKTLFVIEGETEKFTTEFQRVKAISFKGITKDI